MPIKNYWLTTADLAEVYGLAPSTICARMAKDKLRSARDRLLPVEETHLGRSKVWDKKVVLEDLRSKGITPPKSFPSLGIEKPYVEEGDELLSVEDVMRVFDYTSRPEFQHRVRDGAMPKPDYHYHRPFPSFWLRSSVEAWIEKRKSVLSYKKIANGHYQVQYGTKTVGEVERFVSRVDNVRQADGSLVERTIHKWRVVGRDGVYDSRKRAAMSLIPKPQS